MHAMSDWMRITDRNGVILKFKYKYIIVSKFLPDLIILRNAIAIAYDFWIIKYIKFIILPQYALVFSDGSFAL